MYLALRLSVDNNSFFSGAAGGGKSSNNNSSNSNKSRYFIIRVNSYKQLDASHISNLWAFSSSTEKKITKASQVKLIIFLNKC